jgi:hypothetical protein
MEEQINEPRKICPACGRKYSGGDSYCSNDGTALVAGTAQASEPEIVRDTNPDLQAPVDQQETKV